LLAGEYAVLEGATALVIAVDRFATAVIETDTQSLSPFLRAAQQQLAHRYGTDSKAARAMETMRVDTREMMHEGSKIGLGSSAAAVVSSIACALAKGGHGATLDEITDIAIAAHAQAQLEMGSIAGSGVDVLASIHGGILTVRRDLPNSGAGAIDSPVVPLRIERLEACPIHFVWVWTRRVADTRELLARVHRFKEDCPPDYRRVITEVADCSEALIAAFQHNDAHLALAAISAGGAAVKALGERAAVPLFLDVHTELAGLAAPHGGVVKPTGAGGGDIALAAFSTPDQAEAFCLDLRNRGTLPIQASSVERGVVVAADEEQS